MIDNAAGVLAAYVTGESSMGKDTRQKRPERIVVARLAYQLYEARGREAGHDIQDWLRAEVIIAQRR